MDLSISGIRYIYFVGIGGIGMSAIARWFNSNHKIVEGYDKTQTPLTDTLSFEGIKIHYEDNLQSISDELLSAPKKEVLCVYTPAIPKGHTELNYFQQNGYTVLKRSEILGLITKEHFCIGVAGTHGKTTTSSLLAHMLADAGKNCTAFLGGISANYQSNLLLAPDTDKPQLVVVEADEFDRSFLRLFPNIEIITTAEADHLDIYGDEQAVKDSFNAFIEKMPSNDGTLFYQHDVVLSSIEKAHKSYAYGLGKGSIQVTHIRIENHCFTFDLQLPDTKIEGIQLAVPGYHNVENAIAAAAVCWQLGLATDEIKKGIETYKGVKRRFEYIHKSEHKVYIDDYAHHPTEVSAFIKSAKALYPEDKLTVIFQPHLFTRTRDFAEGFAESLSLADKVLLMDIYPARELPIEGVTSKIIFEKITTEKEMIKEADLLSVVSQDKNKILATVGAGNIDIFVPQLKDLLAENNQHHEIER